MSERLGIVGSGAIACGIAAVAVRRGPVVLWARSEASADRARDHVERLLARLDADASVEDVLIVTDHSALADATFLIEAVAEDEQLKSDLLSELHGLVSPHAIISSTTSSLSVERLGQASGRPERFAGLHVFNPVTKMELIELVFPAAATEETRSRTQRLCEALGKRAVLVPDVPGFVVNRLLFPFLFAAVELLEEAGMAAADVDDCMRLGAGHPLGPLALLDLVGLDVAVAIGETIGTPVPARVRELVARGSLGRKSGTGFHDYS